MEKLISSLTTASRRIVAIGTSTLISPDNWTELKNILATKVKDHKVKLQIVAESDNYLFQKSLKTDVPYVPGGERITFKQLTIRRGLILQLIEDLKEFKHASFVQSNLPLPISAVLVDDEIWWLPDTGSHLEHINRYQKLEKGDSWYELIYSYCDRILDSEKDGRYNSSRNEELIELFDQERKPRGIYPRNCFYDKDHYQFVVWGFVFNRAGKILIHKRGANAKDNQNMWDKSIGGHVDFAQERSSSTTAARELVEELFTEEKVQQTGHKFTMLKENKDKLYYLGHWRAEGRGVDYLSAVELLEEGSKSEEEPWFYYKAYSDSIERETPRIMPNQAGERKLRVLADIFYFIGNTLLDNQDYLNLLKNSHYRLVAPSVLKTWIENRKDDLGEEFFPTPDLDFIMSSKLRDEIDEVSQLIQFSSIRRG